MRRIVLDTNCLVQSVAPRGGYFDIWLSILNGSTRLCVTTEILEEYEEILIRLAGIDKAQAVVQAITDSEYTVFCSPQYRFNLIQADKDDNKFVDCAITAGAKLIVTEDHHYNALRNQPFPKLDIVGLDDFIRMLRKE